MDVDALCACKILQFLFKGDDVEHTIIPVAGKSDVKAAYSCHADQVKHPWLPINALSPASVLLFTIGMEREEMLGMRLPPQQVRFVAPLDGMSTEC